MAYSNCIQINYLKESDIDLAIKKINSQENISHAQDSPTLPPEGMLPNPLSPIGSCMPLQHLYKPHNSCHQ